MSTAHYVPGDVLRPRPGVQITPLLDGTQPDEAQVDGGVVVRHSEGTFVLRGAAAILLARLLPRLDGKRTVADLVRELPGEPVRALLLSLPRELFERVLASPPAERPVLIVGEGELARRIAERLACPHLSAQVADPSHLQGAALVVTALEDVSYKCLFALQRACLSAGVPSLFATGDPDGVRIGPLTVPGVSPCLACSQLTVLDFLGLEAKSALDVAGQAMVAAVPPALLDRVAEAAATEAEALLDPKGRPKLLRESLLISADAVHRHAVERSVVCPLCCEEGCSKEDCSEEGAAAPGLTARGQRLIVESAEHLPPRAAAADGADLVTTVGILGGGTAGYLTALALRRRLPHLAVSLIESSEVPIIGVGEATTPLLPHFLHVDLGLDAAGMFRQVRPTLKLGIRFLWGLPETGDFNYPFGPIHVLEPAAYAGDQHACSLQSLLMSADAVPLYTEGEEQVCSMGTSVAYHLDNERFVAWLRREAEAAGVERIEATIASVERSEDGGEVRALVDRDGRRFARDLWVDASGFRSLLLEKTLESPWVSYADSLFTDRAVVAPVAHHGAIRPYTTAETMSCGWCWSTPQVDADHRGYVFASAFQTPEDAEAEMRRVHRGLGEARLVRFRAGRHEHFWKGNVVALGNSYAFVEPLESTALHMLILQIGELLQAFPLRRGERGRPALVNQHVADWWDYLRWFLALHFRFNRRLDSPFWQTCRQDVDVSAHGELLEAIRERGPLSYDPAMIASFDTPDPLLWGAAGVDAILLGQGEWGHLPTPWLTREAWRDKVCRARRTVARALRHDRALELLARRPDLLEDFVDGYRAHGPAFRLSSSAE